MLSRIKKLIILSGVVMGLGLCPARAQTIVVQNPGGDGTFEAIATSGLEGEFGQLSALNAPAAPQNNFNGYIFSFQNPTGPGGGNAGQTGDSIMGDNYGGVYFAEGTEVDNENSPGVYTGGPNDAIYQVTSYSGPHFLGPPSANDTVVFEQSLPSKLE